MATVVSYHSNYHENVIPSECPYHMFPNEASKTNRHERNRKKDCSDYQDGPTAAVIIDHIHVHDVQGQLESIHARVSSTRETVQKQRLSERGSSQAWWCSHPAVSTIRPIQQLRGTGSLNLGLGGEPPAACASVRKTCTNTGFGGVYWLLAPSLFFLQALMNPCPRCQQQE